MIQVKPFTVFRYRLTYASGNEYTSAAYKDFGFVFRIAVEQANVGLAGGIQNVVLEAIEGGRVLQTCPVVITEEGVSMASYMELMSNAKMLPVAEL